MVDRYGFGAITTIRLLDGRLRGRHILFRIGSLLRGRLEATIFA